MKWAYSLKNAHCQNRHQKKKKSVTSPLCIKNLYFLYKKKVFSQRKIQVQAASSDVFY